MVRLLREMNVTPHVAQNDTKRSSAIDGRTTRHAGYEVSQRKRKRVEEIFGWLKTVGPLRKVKYRGVELVDWIFRFELAAYNLVRIRNLTMVGAGLARGSQGRRGRTVGPSPTVFPFIRGGGITLKGRFSSPC
jgi:hypothetical protein